MIWQPIETAPKDGAWVLVFQPGGNPTVHVVRWAEPQWAGGAKTWVTMAVGPNPDTFDVDDATHWLPIPDPPTLA